MVERVRFEACRREWDPSQSGGGNCFLDRIARHETSVSSRFFLLTSTAFNPLAGTGYFFFSGVTNFGDWAVVIADLPMHWPRRTLLVVAGMAASDISVLVVGIGLLLCGIVIGC